MTRRRRFFERNVQDAGLLREFIPNYRLPHTDKNGAVLKVGDDVTCEAANGSWIDGESFVVLKLGVVSRAGEVEGHLLQADNGITVAPVECVIKSAD